MFSFKVKIATFSTAYLLDDSRLIDETIKVVIGIILKNEIVKIEIKIFSQIHILRC